VAKTVGRTRNSGRPTKLDADLAKAALEAIQVGATRADAADRIGIDERTLYRWLSRDREPYASFARDIKRAESDAKLLAIGVVRSAMLGGQVLSRETVERVDAKGRVTTRVTRETLSKPEWTAAMTWLERRFPREWGRIDRVEMTVTDRVQAIAEELGLPYDVVYAEAQRQMLTNASGPRALPASRNGAA
jgi:transposase-like protein